MHLVAGDIITTREWLLARAQFRLEPLSCLRACIDSPGASLMLARMHRLTWRLSHACAHAQTHLAPLSCLRACTDSPGASLMLGWGTKPPRGTPSRSHGSRLYLHPKGTGNTTAFVRSRISASGHTLTLTLPWLAAVPAPPGYGQHHSFRSQPDQCLRANPPCAPVGNMPF